MRTPLLVISSLFVVGCMPWQQQTTPRPVEPVVPAPKASLQTYTDTAIGYTMDVPGDWTITKNDTVTTDEYQAVGTSFAYPADRDRTVLFDAKVHIASLSTCPTQENETHETVNGVEFKKSVWDGVGAGNRYQGETYTTEHNGSCVVVTLYTHSCNLGGSDCGENHALPNSTEDTLFKLKWVFQSLKFS